MDSHYAHESPLATPQRNNFLLDLIYGGGGGQEEAGLSQRTGGSRVLQTSGGPKKPPSNGVLQGPRLLFETHSKAPYQENIYSGSASNFNQLRNNNSSKLLSQLSPLIRQLSAEEEAPRQTQINGEPLTTTRKQPKVSKDVISPQCVLSAMSNS